MHLERWLEEFPADQLHVIDGEQLRTDPVAVMMQLQHFLQVQNIQDYSNLIRCVGFVSEVNLLVLFPNHDSCLDVNCAFAGDVFLPQCQKDVPLLVMCTCHNARDVALLVMCTCHNVREIWRCW